MIIPSLAGFVAGETVTGAKLTAHTKGAFDFLVRRPFCSVTGTVLLNDTTLTFINFNNVIEDNDSMADTANGRIKINTPGLYRVQAWIPWNVASTGGTYRQNSLYAGALGAGSVAQVNGPPTSSFPLTHFLTWTKRLIVGDVCRAEGYQNSGGSMSLGTCQLSAEWILA